MSKPRLEPDWRDLSDPENVKSAVRTKRIDTKAAIIDVSEKLFGELGINFVSLREIARQIGQSNNNAVQYHFRGKQDLIDAILINRVKQMEKLRLPMSDKLSKIEHADLRSLLYALLYPILTIKCRDNTHVFARFLLQYSLWSGISHHPAYIWGAEDRNRVNFALQPNGLVSLVKQIQSRCKNLTESVFQNRIESLSLMFLSSVVEHDNAQKRDGAPQREYNLTSFLDMAIGALQAPCTEE